MTNKIHNHNVALYSITLSNDFLPSWRLLSKFRFCESLQTTVYFSAFPQNKHNLSNNEAYVGVMTKKSAYFDFC